MGGDLAGVAGDADRVVVVDTETTGLYNSDRIVEIALVTLALDGTVIDVFETLVDPERDVSAVDIHGITASMLNGAPTFDQVAGEIAVRVNGACIAAHNSPFDLRMLSNDFVRVGGAVVADRNLDTLKVTGMRLSEACSWYGIDHREQHRALSDAVATADLVRSVAAQLAPAAPAAVDYPRLRSPRLLRRSDTAPVELPDPPLIVYLATRLKHTNASAKIMSYLDIVDRGIADLHLDREERTELAELAASLGLSSAQIGQAHRRFINELIDAAVDDHIVDDDDYDMLLRVAASLNLDQQIVENRIRLYREQVDTVRLAAGTRIVITGNHPEYSREHLIDRFERRGWVCDKNVTRRTEVLAVVDPSTSSGKAKKARQYGVPIVAIADLYQADQRATVAGGQTSTRVAITCPECLATHTEQFTVGVRRNRVCFDCAAG